MPVGAAATVIAGASYAGYRQTRRAREEANQINQESLELQRQSEAEQAQFREESRQREDEARQRENRIRDLQAARERRKQARDIRRARAQATAFSAAAGTNLSSTTAGLIGGATTRAADNISYISNVEDLTRQISDLRQESVNILGRAQTAANQTALQVGQYNLNAQARITRGQNSAASAALAGQLASLGLNAYNAGVFNSGPSSPAPIRQSTPSFVR